MSSRDEGIIDVERRKSTAEYTLGDPTVFPPEFLGWLKRFIEQSGISLPASSIIGGFQPGGGSVRNLAAGIILPFGGGTAPPGSLVCDGTSVSRATYPLLFAEIGVLWGTPVDSLTFKLPDLRDRALYGQGVNTVGYTDGQPHGSRGPLHRHNPAPSDVYGLKDVGTNTGYGGGGGDGVKTPFTVGPAGTPLDGPAHATVLYVITTGQ